TAVEYAFNITRLDTSLENTDRTQRLLSAFYQTLGGLGGDLSATARLSLFLKDPKAVDPATAEKQVLRYPLPSFAQKVGDRRERRVWEKAPPPSQEGLAWLEKHPTAPHAPKKEPPPPALVADRLLHDFPVETDDPASQLDLLRLDDPLAKPETEIQPRYR